jgi:hypothetical protein
MYVCTWLGFVVGPADHVVRVRLPVGRHEPDHLNF